jgi:hypothetical protein
LKNILIILILSNILNASTKIQQEQQKFLYALAEKVNNSIKTKNRFPSTKTRIESLKVQENYTLDINYESVFTDFTLKKKYYHLHRMEAKKKFCTNNFYNRMKDGLTLDIYHYNQNKKLITSFTLDATNCAKMNKKLNFFSKHKALVF